MNLLFNPTPMEDVEKHKIVKVRENLISMQICTTIPPNEKHTINEELRKSGLAESGTTRGWELAEEVEPCECAEIKGRWHYICKC